MYVVEKRGCTQVVDLFQLRKPKRKNAKDREMGFDCGQASLGLE